jgi:hypothetical protein
MNDVKVTVYNDEIIFEVKNGDKAMTITLDAFDGIVYSYKDGANFVPGNFDWFSMPNEAFYDVVEKMKNVTGQYKVDM